MKGQGGVIVRIGPKASARRPVGAGEEMIDLQPCGGARVARLREIAPARLGWIEKNGCQNRRVDLHLVG